MRRNLTTGTVLALLLALSGIALAHTSDFTIPGYGRWSHSTTHYVYNPWGALQFSYPAYAEFEQFNSSGFWWRWAQVGAGTEYTGPAWYGDLYIIQHTGATLYYSSTFFCDRIPTWNAIGFSAFSVPPGSYWHQYSTTDDCYNATPYTDYMRVAAAP